MRISNCPTWRCSRCQEANDKKDLDDILRRHAAGEALPETPLGCSSCGAAHRPQDVYSGAYDQADEPDFEVVEAEEGNGETPAARQRSSRPDEKEEWRGESARQRKRRRRLDLGKVNVGLAIHYGGMVAFLLGQAAAWLGLVLLLVALVVLRARNPDAPSVGALVVSGVLFLAAWGLVSCSSLADVVSSAFCLLAPDATARGFLIASLVVRLLVLPAGCFLVVMGLPGPAALASSTLVLAGWGLWVAFLRALSRSLSQPQLAAEAGALVLSAVKFTIGWAVAIGLIVGVAFFLTAMRKIGGCFVGVIVLSMIFGLAGFIRGLVLSDRFESLGSLVLTPTGIPLTMRYLDLIGTLRTIILRRS
jgi:hypothetical protein